jgi:hypothetical protein
MDALQAMVMNSVAGLCKNNSIILFRHLCQFFGKANSNRIIRFFSGNEFLSFVDRQIHKDKTIIDFWFEHQNNNIKTRDKLQNLTLFDHSVGGDYRFVSSLFHIAVVSHR